MAFRTKIRPPVESTTTPVILAAYTRQKKTHSQALTSPAAPPRNYNTPTSREGVSYLRANLCDCRLLTPLAASWGPCAAPHHNRTPTTRCHPPKRLP